MEENLEVSSKSKWGGRKKRNCFIFILSYFFMGCVTGITNDSFTSYLNITAPDVVKAMPMYTSIGTLILAIALLFVHRAGYKKFVIGGAILSIVSLIACTLTSNSILIAVAYVMSFIGIALFDYMYPLMFTSYSPKHIRVKLFSLVMITNLISQSLVTFFNGKWVVKFFARFQGISYARATELSSTPEKIKGAMLTHYIDAYQAVIWIAVGLTVIALLSAFFLKEKVSDYQESEDQLKARKAEKAIDFSILTNKTIVLWVIYQALVRFGALLVTVYFPIYLNNFLHIDRGTVSTIITLQTLAMVIGYFFAPWLEKKMGAIVAKAVTTLACIPLMLLMAKANVYFGASVALGVGVVLFLRSGLANAGVPIQQSLQMTFVSKNLQPAFSSLMMIVNAAVGIIAGLFTKNILLVHNSGYGHAYYITSIFYLVANIMLLVCFTKKFNRAMSTTTEEEANEDYSDDEELELKEGNIMAEEFANNELDDEL